MEPSRKATQGRFVTVAALVLVFGSGTLLLGHSLLPDPTRGVLLSPPSEKHVPPDDFWLLENDLRFGTALIARNARTLVTRPWRLLDIEQCYPAERALALGEPLIVQGLIGVPVQLVTRNPIAIFNAVVLLTFVLSALCMYLLVSDLSGSRAAGLVAGLLYGFHPIKTHDPAHFFVWDGAWTVLAFFFAHRLFVHARTRDAAGLAGVVALQALGSPYPLLAAFLLAIPAGAWLIARFGLRWPVALRTLPAITAGALVAIFFHAAYLDLRAEGTLSVRTFQAFFPYAWMAPGERFALGPVLVLLALAGVILAGRRSRTPALGDCRWVLLAGGALCMVFAAGGNLGDVQQAVANGRPRPFELPNPWFAVVPLLPGLDVIRSPAALFSGVHLALAALAGLGAAAILRLAPPRSRTWIGVGLVLAAFVDTVRPPLPGIPPGTRYLQHDIGPSDESLSFFEQLDGRGNQGPLLEIWSEPGPPAVIGEGLAVLRTAFHHRPTSACMASFRPAHHARLWSLRRALPDPGALEAIRALGFTTILLHHPADTSRPAALRESLDHHARTSPGGELEIAYADTARTAYAIVLDRTEASRP